MHDSSAASGPARLKFERIGPMIAGRVPRPLAERILRRCQRIASMLAAVGAKSVPNGCMKDEGALAAMMAVSGSIDWCGRQRKSYQFHIRSSS